MRNEWGACLGCLHPLRSSVHSHHASESLLQLLLQSTLLEATTRRTYYTTYFLAFKRDSLTVGRSLARLTLAARCLSVRLSLWLYFSHSSPSFFLLYDFLSPWLGRQLSTKTPSNVEEKEKEKRKKKKLARSEKRPRKNETPRRLSNCSIYSSMLYRYSIMGGKSLFFSLSPLDYLDT